MKPRHEIYSQFPGITCETKSVSCRLIKSFPLPFPLAISHVVRANFTTSVPTAGAAMSDATPQQPSAEGRRFSYVMGGPDPFDQADKGWVGVAEATEDNPRPKQIPRVSAQAEDEADGGEEEEQEKQKAWRRNEDIPMRFDELPTEEKWINVSDVIRRQREEQALREAKQNKVRPPPDPEGGRPEAPSDSDDDDDAVKRGNREKQEGNSARLRERQESNDSEEDSAGVDTITESMLQFALKPGLMGKDRGLGRRSSLPATPTPAYGKLDRRGFLWPAAERPPRRSSFTEEEEERPPLRHRPQEQHIRRGRSPRHSFSEDRVVERRPDREPSPDYELDDSPPRSPYRQEYEPGRRGHRPHDRHHDPYYEDDRRQRYPDDDWGYDHDPRSYGREDPDDDYPGGRHPMESRYDEDYYPRPSGYDRGAYDDSPERHYEGDRRRDYFRQHSDPRHERGSQAYSHPQYR